MSIFKEASKKKLRFNTNKGNLSVEQLWDLSLNDLDTLAVSLEKQYKASGKKSFLEVDTKEDKVTKLKFDITLEILKDKVEERERLQKSAEIKEHNQKIMSLIKAKREEKLKDMSEEELEKMLK